MPFSQAVRQDALVASARHCCVCRKFAGLSIEVHHIVPESQGGSNAIANAIALCFDCHADAGHFFAGHPKGTKLSAAELRKHRTAWSDQVREGRVPQPTDDNLVHCMYFVGRDGLMSWENGTPLDWFPRAMFGDPLLAESPITPFHRKLPGLVKWYGASTGDAAQSWTAYLAAHPDSEVRGSGACGSAVRSPSSSELRGRADALTDQLLAEGAPAQELAYLTFQETLFECGGESEHWTESVSTRSLSPVLLAIRNTSGVDLIFSGIEGDLEQPDGLCYRTAAATIATTRVSLRTPPAPVPPGAVVLVPALTLMRPFRDGWGTLGWDAEIPSNVGDGASTRVGRERIQGFDTGRFHVIGPRFRATALVVETRTGFRQQGLRDLDPTRLYSVNRSWEMGSCPHLFFELESGARIYAGELFSRSGSTVATERRIAPPGSARAWVAELEHEVTMLTEIVVAGRPVSGAVELRHGDSVAVGCRGGDVVEVTGSYLVGAQPPLTPEWLRWKTERVERFEQQIGAGLVGAKS